MQYITVTHVAISRKAQGLRSSTRQAVLYQLHKQGLIPKCFLVGTTFQIPEKLAIEKLGYLPELPD